jgi:hypothetical protein
MLKFIYVEAVVGSVDGASKMPEKITKEIA